MLQLFNYSRALSRQRLSCCSALHTAQLTATAHTHTACFSTASAFVTTLQQQQQQQQPSKHASAQVASNNAEPANATTPPAERTHHRHKQLRSNIVGSLAAQSPKAGAATTADTASHPKHLHYLKQLQQHILNPTLAKRVFYAAKDDSTLTWHYCTETQEQQCSHA